MQHTEGAPVSSAPSPLSPCSFVFPSASLRLRGEECLRLLPALTGAPIRIESVPGLRDRRGAVHAGSLLRQRRIAFNCAPAEFPRIFVHELFHFVWLRAGNPLRRSWESRLKAELVAHARGELGWSAEWRKEALRERDVADRTRRWREYCCESFCDTAAWLFASNESELTLSLKWKEGRNAWFARHIGSEEARSGISI